MQHGVLIDMYARSDITQLAKGNAYNRLQWEEVTVGQALALALIASPPWPNAQSGPVTPVLPCSCYSSHDQCADHLLSAVEGPAPSVPDNLLPVCRATTQRAIMQQPASSRE